eukprot:Transcript_10239.p3 GENE.Transcript_10239~~Transcript_10239.p3  ORF type:complete len:281 (+),score=107.81 Transcript_10239:598-1440(+)
MTVDTFPMHSVVFDAGQMEDQLFLLLEGCVSVYQGAPPPPFGEGPEDAQLISRHDATGGKQGKGGGKQTWLGEMALWANRPTNASVVATEPSKLLVLGKASFDRFMNSTPEFKSLFKAHSNAFARLTQLTSNKQKFFAQGSRSIVGRALSNALRKDEGRAARVRGETAHLSAAERMIVHRWERLTSALLSLETGKGAAPVGHCHVSFSLECEAFAFCKPPRQKALSPEPATQTTTTAALSPVRATAPKSPRSRQRELLPITMTPAPLPDGWPAPAVPVSG